MRKLIRLLKKHWVLVLPILLFSLLLARDPFSERTLIPNLEPFPDSFHYLSPALNFNHGKGFFIGREDRYFKPDVPPLYSLILSPFLLLKEDVRMFYFANVLLAFASFFLFYLITKKLFHQKIIQLLLLMLYAMSEPLNWFPAMAMAENVILPLFLLGVYLLIEVPTAKKAVLAGFVAVAFYATKYASLPLAVSFSLLYFGHVFLQRKHTKKSFYSYLLSLGVWIGLYLIYELLSKQNNVIGGLWGLFIAVFFPKPVAEGGVGQGGGEFFATRFIDENINAYLGWLIGNPIQTIWRKLVILPKPLAIAGSLGLVLGLFTKQTRYLAFSLVGMLASIVALMMVFYAHDGRYFIVAVPTLFIGLGFFCSSLFARAKTFEMRAAIVTLLVGVLIGYFGTHAKELKLQIAINLRYAETPWYYISIRKMDEFLTQHKSEFTKRPVVISALTPYHIDFYSKEDKLLLPLHPQQDFRSKLTQAWGDYDYSDLPALYTDFLEKGHPVYIAQYGLGNVGYLNSAYKEIFEKFETREVQLGCHNLCNIHQLIRVRP